MLHFAFLVDKKGVIHVRIGTTSDLSRVTGAASQSICPEFSQFECLACGASGKGAVTKEDCEAERELAGGRAPPAR